MDRAADSLPSPAGAAAHRPGMPNRILVPLIVACALFMENLDFDGSLDVAAGDRGRFRGQPDPPQAGADVVPDRAGDLHSGVRLARRPLRRPRHLPAGDPHLHGRLDPVRHLAFDRGDRLRAHRPGIGRRDDGAGRAAGDPQNGVQGRAGRLARVADGPGAGRPGHRPAGRRLHHHVLRLAVDLLDQRAGRHRGLRARDPVHPGRLWRRGPMPSTGWASRCPASAWPCSWPDRRRSASGCCRRRRSRCSSRSGRPSSPLYVLHSRRPGQSPIIDLTLLRIPTFRHSLTGGLLFRIGIGAMPFLLPLLLQVGFGMSPFESG